MFWIRFRSSVILMIITILSVVIGGDLLFTIVGGISLIGMYELFKVFQIHSKILGIIGYLAAIVYFTLVRFELNQYILLFVVFYLLFLMVVYVFQFPKYDTNHITIVFFGLFYVAIMLSYIYQARMLDGGVYLIWLIFIGAWGSDTCAYLVGRKFGKHKLAPVLSPKKSVEGCIGGIIGAAVIGFIYATIFRNHITGVANPQLAYAIIGGCGSIISQIGDLAASAIKRNHDVKDYGTLIPGHGGILDRFDSIIFTAPIVFYLANVL